MAGFKLTTFSGLNTKISPRLLPEDVAQNAKNVFLDSGRIEGLKQDTNHSSEASNTHPASHISASTKTIFQATSSNWLTFTEDVDIIRSPIKEDSFGRLYFTGSGSFPKYGGQANILSGSGPYPATSFRLGLPTPGAITSISVNNATAATGAAVSSRAYIYTEVTTFGEEGPPTAVASGQIVDAADGATVTLGIPAATSGNYSIAKRRLYRTDINGVFRFVADISGTSSGSVQEAVTDNLLAEEIESSDNLAPPDDSSSDHPDGPMLGITSMPNGITAGFSGNTLLFSEAFLPHSYPVANQLTTSTDVVAIASIASGLLVTTKGKPLMVSGTDPSAMAMVEIDANLPCSNKRSLVDMGEYAIYSSPDGLVLASNSGIQLITQNILTRDQWQANYYPTNVEGYEFEGKYIGFTFDGSDNSTKKGFIFDPRGGKNAFVNLDFFATAGYNDRENDLLYLVIGGILKTFASSSSVRSYEWKSKQYYTNRPISPGVAKVSADSYNSLTFKLFADGSLKHTQTVANSEIFRLPGGYKAKLFEIQLEGTDTINEVCVYESPQEIT